MKSNLLSKSESSKILKSISESWKIDPPKVKNLKLHEIEEGVELITADGLSIVHTRGDYVPYLAENEDILAKFPYVEVDMGAIKFVCNGANIMRPGITGHSEFKENEIVTIKEEKHKKFLAVGRSLTSSDKLESVSKGEVVKTVHYVSDKIWEAAKEIKP